MDKNFNQNKLEVKGRRQPVARKTHRRFFTALDMAIVKHDEAALNGRVKRGERARHVVDKIYPCSCGKEGCFIHTSSNP